MGELMLSAVETGRVRSGAARSWLGAAATLIVVTLLAVTAWAAIEDIFPPLSGRVVDAAKLLSPEDEAALTTELAALENTSSDQLVVVTLPDLGGYVIEDVGYQLGRHWGIGQASEDNGVLLIVAPNERKVRIEVGRGLEGTLPDALAGLIVQHTILPKFRDGDFPGGIRAGVADIKQALLGNAAEVEQRALARRRGQDTMSMMEWLIVAIFLTIFAFVLFNEMTMTKAERAARARGARRRNGGWGPTVGPWGGSGRRGGGGFGGGGGGFGGGGASGGW